MNRFAGIYEEVMPSLGCAWRGEVSIERIARRLSRICRYQGDADGGYSVAQHSLHVSDRCSSSPQAALAGLLHDVPEALVLGDVCALVRGRVTIDGEPLNNIETRFLWAINGRHELPIDLTAEVVEADHIAGLIEARDLTDLTHWQGEALPRMSERLMPKPRDWVEYDFVQRYHALVEEVGRCAHAVPA